MKLIVLYGPPGVGKLTVARTLAKKTGYKVLHNHLTIELLCSLFDWGSAPYNKLVHKLRLELLETATRYRIKGVIITFVYGAEADIKEVKDLLFRMRRRKVTVHFVQLMCLQSELERRIKHHSRKEFTKIRHVQDLRILLKRFNTLEPIPVGNNFVIDTTKLGPQGTASRIIAHFKL